MPFTPLHLGPGAAFKALGGARFSFMVFGGSQVLMDLEPMVQMLRGASVLHGSSHTLGGALAIGALAGAIGRPISAFVLERLRIPHHPFTWRASFAGAFVGTLSHLLLDGLMHPDMHPLRPLSDAAPWFGALPVGALHLACLALGALGGAVVCVRLWVDGKA